MTQFKSVQYDNGYYYVCTLDGNSYLWKDLVLRGYACDRFTIEEDYSLNAYYRTYGLAQVAIHQYYAKERSKSIIHTRL